MRCVKHTILAVALTLVILAQSLVPVLAASTDREMTIPVTLTVVNTVKSIDVTMPASMPISVYDDKVLTADNVAITNNSTNTHVGVVSIVAENGAYDVEHYMEFPDNSASKVALSINGCGTVGPGEIPIKDGAFSQIEPQTSLPINYKAKVSSSGDVTGLEVAKIIFTLRAI